MTGTRAAAVLWLACACGPVVAVDGGGSSGGDDDDDMGSTSRNETASSEGGSTAPGTATVPMPMTFPTTAGSSEDSGGSSSSGAEESCAQIEVESLACMFVDGDTVHLVGMDSGRICDYAELDTPLYPNALVWSGNELLVCDGDLSAYRVDLIGGTVTGIANVCRGASPHAGGILVKHDVTIEPVLLYDSIDAFVAEEFTTVDVLPYASHIAAEGDVLYAAWHSTSYLEVWDLATETRLDDLSLAGFDDRINGLAVVDDLVLVLGQSEVLGFDTGSGDNILDVGLPDTFAPGGLACR